MCPTLVVSKRNSWHHHKITDQERFNAAADYNYGRDNAAPELGYPAISLDDYILMVRYCAPMAMSLERTKKSPEEEIQEILDSLG